MYERPQRPVRGAVTRADVEAEQNVAALVDLIDHHPDVRAALLRLFAAARIRKPRTPTTAMPPRQTRGR